MVSTDGITSPTTSCQATRRSCIKPATCVAALLVCMLWAYWPTLAEVVQAWNSQPDYSHGFLVAPIAIFFLWLRRDAFPKEWGPSAAGLAILAVVAGLRLAAGVYFLQPLDAWTIPLWMFGATWTLFGPRVVRWSWPSLAFLWFMFPLPYSAEKVLSVPLQSIATKLSTAALVILGQPALAEGNTIWLDEQPIFVEEACSGIRILMGISALAFAFVLFSKWAWWQKALAVLAVPPIAILANVLRIVVTGLLYTMVSGEAAHSFSHDLSGILMIPVAAAGFWAFLTYLEHLFPMVEIVTPASHFAHLDGSNEG